MSLLKADGRSLFMYKLPKFKVRSETFFFFFLSCFENLRFVGEEKDCMNPCSESSRLKPGCELCALLLFAFQKRLNILAALIALSYKTNRYLQYY